MYVLQKVMGSGPYVKYSNNISTSKVAKAAAKGTNAPFAVSNDFILVLLSYNCHGEILVLYNCFFLLHTVLIKKVKITFSDGLIHLTIM